MDVTTVPAQTGRLRSGLPGSAQASAASPAQTGRLRSGLPGSAQASAASPALPPGTAVEVCNRFSRTWTRGFEVVAVTTCGGYRLLRVSDRYELPAEFRTDEIREIPLAS